MKTQDTRYDSVVYPSYTHPQTHPDRLAVIGALFGLKPAGVNGCRVLELGCGNGSNLVPMAWGLPQSEFVGIDLAARAVARGQQMVSDLAMSNVRLIHGNITEISDDFGKFDYIIAHGIYSWVPAAVQKQVFSVCRRLLGPHGIAFVSYNAFPGSHLRNMLREMMLFHVRAFDSAEERVNQAVALVRFVADAQDTRDEYRLWMKAELEGLLEHEPGHLYHDELSDLNQPLYFTQFMERAASHGLQYVGEADFFEMFAHGLNDSVRETLDQLARNRILREQYLDFLKCRRFRQTLLCHREVGLRTEPQAEIVADFLVSSPAKCGSRVSGVPSGAKTTYETPKGGTCETDFELGKAALAVLGMTWPMPLAFEGLFERAVLRLRQTGVECEDDAESRKTLCGFLLQLYGAGVVEFRVNLPPVTGCVSERPVASPVARWQAQHGNFVSSLFHIAVKVEDEIGRCLLLSLDGSPDRNALTEKICGQLESKNAFVVPDGDVAAARRKVELDLERNLNKLAQLGLLTG
jgi:SAM-dependent methyltransferase